MTAQPPPDLVIVVRGPWQRMALGWEIRNEHGDRLAFVWERTRDGEPQWWFVRAAPVYGVSFIPAGIDEDHVSSGAEAEAVGLIRLPHPDDPS